MKHDEHTLTQPFASVYAKRMGEDAADKKSAQEVKASEVKAPAEAAKKEAEKKEPEDKRTAAEIAAEAWTTIASTTRKDIEAISQRTENNGKSNIEILQSLGVTPAMYKQNPDRYNKLFHEAKTKETRKFERILIQWQNVLHTKDYHESCGKVIFFAEQGITPRRLLQEGRFAEWQEAFPNTPAEDVLKKKKIAHIILEVIKKMVGKPMVDTFDPVEKKNKQAAAGVAWALVEKERDPRDKAQPEEKQTQKIAIEKGLLPQNELPSLQEKYKNEAVEANSRLSDTNGVKSERVQKAMAVIQELWPDYDPANTTEEDAAELLRIHAIGNGENGTDGKPARVGTYTREQLHRKVEGVKAFLQKKGLSDEKVNQQVRDMLIREGILGDPPNKLSKSEQDIYNNLRAAFEQMFTGMNIPLTELDKLENQQVLWKLAQSKADVNDPQVLHQAFSEMKVAIPIPGAGATSADQQKDKEQWQKWNKEATTPFNSHQVAFLTFLTEHGVPFTEENKKIVLSIQSQQELVTLLNSFGRSLGRDPGELEAYYGRQIESMEDMLLDIVEYNPEEAHLWGPDGLYPLYTVVTNPDGTPKMQPSDKKRKKRANFKMENGQEMEVLVRANPGNFHKWVMHQMIYWHNDSPTSKTDFFNKISVFKKANQSPLTLSSIINYKSNYLKTKIYNEDREREEDYVVEDLFDQIIKDISFYQWNRDAHLDYQPIMGESDKVKGFLQGFHGTNNMTRPVWNKASIMRWGYYMPQQFKSAVEKANFSKKGLDQLQSQEPEKIALQDGRIGAATALAELVYRNMNNLDGGEDSLVSLLGRDSVLFQKKKILALRDKLSAGAFGGMVPERVLPKSALDEVFVKVAKARDAETKYRTQWKHDKKFQARNPEHPPMFLWVPNPDFDPGQKADDATNPAEIPINKTKFIGLFNVFDAAMNDPYITTILQNMVKESVIQKHKLFVKDEHRATRESGDAWYKKELKDGKEVFTLVADKKNIGEHADIWVMDATAGQIAENRAFFAMRWTGGAALCDADATGHDWQSRAFYTQTYREKGSTRKRNNMAGLLPSIGAYKATVVDFMRGTHVLSEKSKYTNKYGIAEPVDASGNRVALDQNFEPSQADGLQYEFYTTNDGKEMLYKTPLDVVREVAHAVELANTEGMPLDSEQRRKLMWEITSQFRFREQTQEKYFGDHWARGHKVLEEILLQAKDVDFSKFTEWDVARGRYNVKQAELSKAFEDLVKPWRYGVSTWKQLDLQQEVNIPDGKGGVKMVKDQNGNLTKPCMAQYMFGDELLDHPQFWKRADKGEKGAKKVKVTSAKGEIVEEWRIPHLVDPAEVNTEDGKVQLYLNAVLAHLGANIIQHRRAHHGDVRYEDNYYNSLFAALAKLPGGVLGDEIMSMGSIRIQRNAISELDIQWLREHTGMSMWKMAGWALFKGLTKSLVLGAVESGQKVIKDATK